jgi:dGTPase
LSNGGLGGRGDRVHKNGTSGGQDHRTPFEKDRDRILYSSAFQRLAGITQIVRAGESEVFHTRQQHTIKVAQIGRRLAQSCLEHFPEQSKIHGLDAEVVEAACLAHDLGHPPFGHVGEHVLNELVDKGGDDNGFEGNAQSFRVLTKLAVRMPDNPGLDLTRATLAATIKYPWFRGKAGKKSQSKWSAYGQEKTDFNFARQASVKGIKTLEAELMDWSDDVAYSVHDLEDFHRCNAVPWKKIFDNPGPIISHAMGDSRSQSVQVRLTRVWDALVDHLLGNFSELLTRPYEGTRDQREMLRRMTSQFIGKFIYAIKVEGKPTSRAVSIDQNIEDEVKLLKQITRDYIINSPILAAQQHGQRRIITDLFNEISESSGNGKIPDFLPPRMHYFRDLNGVHRARYVADCIASLTEKEAMGLHGRLFGTAGGSVLDPIAR